LIKELRDSLLTQNSCPESWRDILNDKITGKGALDLTLFIPATYEMAEEAGLKNYENIKEGK
jgi:hypothetical protein